MSLLISSNKYRTATSPTIVSGVSSLSINEDIEGQTRPSVSNAGADHFSVESVRYQPLKPEDVGPNAYGDEQASDYLYTTSTSEFSATGGKQTVTITSNLNWTVSDNSDWITTSAVSGSNNGSIEITLTANNLLSIRNGEVTITSDSLTRTLSILQAAADPTTGLNLINDGSANDIVTVKASTEQVDNVTYFNFATNTLDKNHDSRWSGEGIGAELIFDLGKTYKLDLVAIATLLGKTYLYEILTSTDGINFTSVSNVQSNTLGTFENFKVTNQVQFVKIIGGGQSGGSVWNTITEIEFYGTSILSNGDADGDGILDEVDKCSNTPQGTLVDANGCTLLTADNFSIEVVGETCVDKKNGQLKISAKEIINYKLTVNSNNFSFTTNKTLDNLSAGIYTICIEVAGVTSPYCYTVEVEKGKIISGKSSLNSKQLQVEVTEGTLPYKVFVNEKLQFETIQSNFNVEVNKGDLMKVKLSVECEGSYSERIMFTDEAIVYPNPTAGLCTILVPNTNDKVKLEVFNELSQLINSKIYSIENGKIQLDLSDKPIGVYIIKLHTEKTVQIFKVLKK